MTGLAASPPGPARPAIGLDAIFNSIPDAVLVLEQDGHIIETNMGAEIFFGMSAASLQRLRLSDIIAFDSPLLALVDQVFREHAVISEYEIEIGNPRLAARPVDIQVSPLIDHPGHVVILIHERSIAQKIDRQLTHRGAARSVMGMAAILAHEIKNPLSGIRGSAQILEQSVDVRDRELTSLIRDEADRICALVDRMETFSDHRPLEAAAVNLHQVLDHVKRLGAAGFARTVRFHEIYDPSLPLAHGNKDQLVQVLLNLVKNAAEAVPDPGGDITLTTAYRHGLRLAVPGRKNRVHLPLEICVIDNGPGVPDDLKACLFDPFVTTKSHGTGLGLALVAKIIGDHGGIVECDSEAGRTVFRLLLPAWAGEQGDAL